MSDVTDPAPLVISGRIDWMAHFGNHPRLILKLGRVPAFDAFRWKERRFDSNSAIFWSVLDGHVRYLTEDKQDQTGFGGSKWDLTMEDGSTRVLVGPWSGHAGNLHRLGMATAVEVVNEVAERDHRSDALLVSALEPFLDLIELPPFDPTGPGPYGWGPYTQNGPRVDFPAGAKCRLYLDEKYGCHHPEVELPDGTRWRKPHL